MQSATASAASQLRRAAAPRTPAARWSFPRAMRHWRLRCLRCPSALTADMLQA